MLIIKTLKNRWEFLQVQNAAQPKTPIRTKTFIIKWLATGNKNNIVSFGFIITKKIGNAVIRNKLRRRLKEASKIAANEIAKNLAGTNIIISASKTSPNFSFAEILLELKHGFSQINNIKTRGNEHG